MEVDEDVVAADVLLFRVEAALEHQASAVFYIEISPADRAVLQNEGLGAQVSRLVGVPRGPNDYIRNLLQVGTQDVHS